MQSAHALTCRLCTFVNSPLPGASQLYKLVFRVCMSTVSADMQATLCYVHIGTSFTILVLTFADSVRGGQLKPPISFSTSKKLSTAGRPLTGPEKLAWQLSRKAQTVAHKFNTQHLSLA
jgi:hypothetical protein